MGTNENEPAGIFRSGRSATTFEKSQLPHLILSMPSGCPIVVMGFLKFQLLLPTLYHSGSGCDAVKSSLRNAVTTVDASA